MTYSLFGRWKRWLLIIILVLILLLTAVATTAAAPAKSQDGYYYTVQYIVNEKQMSYTASVGN